MASNPNASPQPSYPWAVVTFTSSESTGGLACAAPGRNGMRSGSVSILAMASASEPHRTVAGQAAAPVQLGRGPRRTRSGSSPAQEQQRGVIAQLAALVVEYRADEPAQQFLGLVRPG